MLSGNARHEIAMISSYKVCSVGRQGVSVANITVAEERMKSREMKL